jgi:hypothetical protein
VQKEEALRDLKARLGELLDQEASALHRAVAISRSDAPQSEVSAAIRDLESIRRRRLEIARQIAEKDAACTNPGHDPQR